MNALEHELLVHISAPSSAKDDRRYISIAQSILEFRPAIVSGASQAISVYALAPAAEEYNVPIDKRRASEKAPDQLRPRTATEACSLTDHTAVSSAARGRRRAHSEVLSSGNSLSIVPNPTSLPDEVRGPDPRGGCPKFTTHLTKPLERLVARIPLSKHFRPVYVSRDLNVLERGYWRFSVRIVEDSFVPGSTTPPLGQRRSSKPKTTNSQHGTAFWTEKELVQFWQNMTHFVQGGKAGWGTRLIREFKGEIVWTIRLFTWGELLGHLWLVLWVLSDKLTGGISMQWIAGDNVAVVKMSGGKNKEGKLGPWIRKGPAGEGGVWGIAEDS